MRHLEAPPSAPFELHERPFDAASDLASGSFAGPLPAIDWGPAARAAGKGPLWRRAHEKRWIYVAIRQGHLLFAAAVVRTGYAATALVWVWDEREKGFLDERVAMAPASSATVQDEGPGRRSARFEAAGLRIVIDAAMVSVDAAPRAARGPGQRASGSLDAAPLHLRARLVPRKAPAIGAIGAIASGLANATQKDLATVEGELLVAGLAASLDGAVAAFDYTNGMLARHTRWRWALALGRAASGRSVALNLVEGFMGEAECALWVDDEIVPVGEGIFVLDEQNPLLPWSVRTQCGSIDLRFEPGALHAQHRDLLLVRSRFLQPAGRFRGTILARGVDLGELDLLGVAEDQDVVW